MIKVYILNLAGESKKSPRAIMGEARIVESRNIDEKIADIIIYANGNYVNVYSVHIRFSWKLTLLRILSKKHYKDAKKKVLDRYRRK